MINLTPEALSELKNMFDTRRDLSYGVRVFVKAVGWGGPVFGVSLDKKHEEDVEVVEKEIPFYLDKGLVDYFKGFHIDFVSGWISKRFLIVPTNGQVSNC